MSLAVVSSLSPDSSWSAVLEAAVNRVGANPRTVWQEALDAFGSRTIGPDTGGEMTSQCPHPLHNGGLDSTPSMRWRQTNDGTVLFDCRGGCGGDDIIEALGLSYLQLRWGRTEYHYRSDLRELLAVHVRAAQPGGKKKFWWEHPENNVLVAGRGPGWEHVLWCLPDMQSAAERAHQTGRSIHLVISEGEKDAISISEAHGQGWLPADQKDDGWTHLVTTSADGAASWSRELSEQVAALRCAQVTIVCDSDQAGTQRGTALIDALHEVDPQLSVTAISWTGQSGIKDATDAIATYGRHWLTRSTQAEDADIYLWCSFETGWLYEADATDVKGEDTGKRALHRMVGIGTGRQRPEAISKWPMRILNVTLDTEGKAVGWELDLGAGGREIIFTNDLTGSNLDAWNAKVGFFIVPARQLAAQLRAYFGFHGSRAGSMTVYDHEGWVDDQRFVTSKGMIIGPEGESAQAALAGTEGTGGAEWHYGLGDPQEAAFHAARLLTFRDLHESGPVMSWLAAQAVRPRALQASGASFVPMLQIPGASGVGKTSFLKLATRLFGFSGNPISNVTGAGLVRTLALTTGVVWIDDFSNYDDAIRGIIRGGLTGAGRTRGTTSSERGIVRDEAYAALINSGEHAFDANERAMSQRSVILPFDRAVQGRMSVDNPGAEQYGELELLGVARDDKGAGLSRWAGTVVRGLWEAAQKVDADKGGRGSGSGIRGQAAWEFVQYGACVMAQWLRDLGISEERVTRFEQVTLEVCRAQAFDAIRREKTGADVYLVQEIVPRYLAACRRNADSAITAHVKTLDPGEVKDAIREAWRSGFGQMAGMGERDPKAVVVLVTRDEETLSETPLAVAVSAHSLYQWASSVEGIRAGVSRDERHISVAGMTAQLKQVADKLITDPEDTATGDGCLRVRLGRGAVAPRYRLITEQEIVQWLCQ